MTKEEKIKAIEELKHIRRQIDDLHAEAFTIFVESVHNLGLMLKPITQNQEVLAYKLTELEGKFRGDLENDSSL